MCLRVHNLKFEAKKNFCCININKTTIGSLQMKVCAHVVCFQANLRLRCGSTLEIYSLYISLKHVCIIPTFL